MKILITSGGTSEKIDQVRSITNHATGKLGAIMADYFAQKKDEVTLITTPTAALPKEKDKIKIHLIQDVAALEASLKAECPHHQVLIHAMAVSDYRPLFMTDFEQVKESGNLEDFLFQKNLEGKISSSSDYQVLFLKKNPKIIQKIKTWQPSLLLIGFKLLVDVEKEDLIQVARENLFKNKADLIVANDLTEVSEKAHHAYLVTEDEIDEAKTKVDIAAKLYQFIHRKARS